MSRAKTKKGRKEVTAEERIQKANGGRESSKGEPRRMELEAVEVGRR